MNHIQRDTIDGVAVLRFDQAGSAANVFNLDTFAEFDRHIAEIAADAKVKGVVLISAKERIFHAGADLTALSSWTGDQVAHFIERGQDVLAHLAALSVPTVAAIHGACLGGGCEMALACDHRIATSDKATKIGLPETKLGILPAWGGSTRLPVLVGVTRALDIILAGKTPAAKQALRYGMIDAIVPREMLLSTALRFLREGFPMPRTSLMRRFVPERLMAAAISPMVRKRIARETRGHYPAVSKAAAIILARPAVSEAESLAHERRAVAELLRGDTCKNLMHLFLLGERARKSEGPKTKAVERAAVIGAGVMGSGIAQWLASRGVPVTMRDINPQAVGAGMDRARKLFGNRRVFTEKEARDGLDLISPTVDLVPLSHTDIVIEAAVEKMDAKKKIFAQLDQHATNPHTILATNTSALSLAEIAVATKNPARVVGLHFFNPVHKMQLVEVVAAPQTDPEVVRRATRFAQQIGKLPVVVRDSPGFVVNRILVPYLLEAALIFENGARATDIDDAMLDFGMPMGPLRLIDEVGVDIAADVAGTLLAKFGDRLKMPELLGKMIEARALGRKSGRGFYVYSGKGKTVPNPALHPPRHSAACLGRAEIQRRLALLIVNEAARCVEEKITSGPEMVDFAMVMGTGFAPFRGGPLRYAESLGLRRVVDEFERLRAEFGPRYERCDLLREMAAEGKHFYAN